MAVHVIVPPHAFMPSQHAVHATCAPQRAPPLHAPLPSHSIAQMFPPHVTPLAHVRSPLQRAMHDDARLQSIEPPHASFGEHSTVQLSPPHDTPLSQLSGPMQRTRLESPPPQRTAPALHARSPSQRMSHDDAVAQSTPPLHESLLVQSMSHAPVPPTMPMSHAAEPSHATVQSPVPQRTGASRHVRSPVHVMLQLDAIAQFTDAWHASAPVHAAVHGPLPHCTPPRHARSPLHVTSQAPEPQRTGSVLHVSLCVQRIVQSIALLQSTELTSHAPAPVHVMSHDSPAGHVTPSHSVPQVT